MSAELYGLGRNEIPFTRPLQMRRSPQEEATTLFANAVRESPYLLGPAVQEAITALQRVIPAYIIEGSVAWRRFFDDHSLLRHYQKGLELVRLFLTHELVTDNGTVQREFYEPARQQVAEAFLRSVTDLPVPDIREIYQRIGLRPRQDGRFANPEYAIFRRTRVLQ